MTLDSGSLPTVADTEFNVLFLPATRYHGMLLNTEYREPVVVQTSVGGIGNWNQLHIQYDREQSAFKAIGC